MRQLIKQAVQDARQKVSKDAELVALIRPLVGRTYSEQAVSAWANGHSNMPADVLLAVAQVTKLSLDELLFGESLTARQDQMEKEVAELRSVRFSRIWPPASLPCGWWYTTHMESTKRFANQAVKFERMTVDGRVVIRVRDGWVSWCSDWIAIHDSPRFETRWELEGIWRQGEFYLQPCAGSQIKV